MKKIVVPKIYSFKEIFLPLSLHWGKVFANGHMAFDFPYMGCDDAIILLENEQENIVAQLNGEDVENPLKFNGLTHSNSYIYFEGKEFISIRGFGHLCGTGGLNLPEKEAAIIQDNFADYIIKILSL